MYINKLNKNVIYVPTELHVFLYYLVNTSPILKHENKRLQGLSRNTRQMLSVISIK